MVFEVLKNELETDFDWQHPSQFPYSNLKSETHILNGSGLSTNLTINPTESNFYSGAHSGHMDQFK